MSSGYGPGGRNTERGGGAVSTAPYDAGYDGHLAAGPQYQNYPPPHNAANPSYMSFNSTTTKNEADVSVRYISRTPSPTPSEDAALNRKGIIDWKAVTHWRYWIRREWICAYLLTILCYFAELTSITSIGYYVILAIILVIVILITVYDKQIVHALQPTAEKIREYVFKPRYLVSLNRIAILSSPDSRALRGFVRVFYL